MTKPEKSKPRRLKPLSKRETAILLIQGGVKMSEVLIESPSVIWVSNASAPEVRNSANFLGRRMKGEAVRKIDEASIYGHLYEIKNCGNLYETLA